MFHNFLFLGWFLKFQDVFCLGAARRCILDRNLKAKLLGETPFGTMKKFYRIKIGREVVHGEGYARVLKRNCYTVVYNEEQGGG